MQHHIKQYHIPSWQSLLIASILSLLLIGCKEAIPKLEVSLDERSLIPLPRKITPTDQTFVIYEKTKVYTSADSASKAIAKQLLDKIQNAYGYTLPLIEKPLDTDEYGIFIGLTASTVGNPNIEAYQLKSNSKQLRLTANHSPGLSRGLQTLYQLLPDSIVGITETPASPTPVLGVPGVVIKDHPNFAYRGAMLDVARHFFTVAQVKRFIDLMGQYKLNVSHLHLADDQGWRIHIKSWPKLSQIGGSTSVGEKGGGFYTQEDYQAIVDYAMARDITIIPEIDMPGHTNAALASYPELNCDGIAPKLYTGMKVGFSSLCVQKELTYKFLDDVIGEIAALTPGPYFHIGGDESHATSKKDYIYFIDRVQAIVKSHGKKVIGWEDISAAPLTAGAVIQHWTNPETASLGISKGAKVILSPAPKTYLDMKYDKDSRIGLTWAGTTTIDSAYLWKPLEVLPTVSKEHILGIESPLWTETVVTTADMDYLVFPRLIAHAELGWSKPSDLNWASFKQRMQLQLQRLDVMGVDYYRSTQFDTTPNALLQK